MSIKESLKNLLTWKKTGEDFSKAVGDIVSKEFEDCLFGKEASKPILNQAVGKIEERIILTGSNGLTVSNMLGLKDVAEALKKHTSSNSSFCKNVWPVLEKTGKWFGFVMPMGKSDFKNLEIANKKLEKFIKELEEYLDEVERSKIKLKNFENANTIKVALTVYLKAVMEAALEKNKKTIQSGLGAQSAQIAQKRNETIKKSANARYDKEKIERAQQLKEIGEAKRANASEIEKYKPLKHRYAILTNLFGCLASLAAELKLEYKEKDYSAIDKTVEKYRGRLQGKMGLRGIVFNKIQKNSDETMNTLLVATGKSNFDDLIKHFEGAQTDCKNALEKYADILDCYMAKDVSKQDIETTVRKLKEEVDAILKGKFGYTDKPYTGVPYAFISYLYSESPRLNKVPRILQ